MESRLLADSVTRKLADLDHKVQAYRHERLLEFERFYRDLVRQVPLKDLRVIEQAILPTLSSYAALQPHLGLASSRSSMMPGSDAFQADPFPSSAAQHPTAVRLHDREHDFQGLFTPSYLPLLDGRSDLPQTAPHADSVATPWPDAPAAVLDPGVSVLPERSRAGSKSATTSRPASDKRPELTMDQPAHPGDWPAYRASPKSPSPRRPHHVRSSTNDTTSSGHSERSDTKAPRSALRRRSSSASKPITSPRRVRFHVKGLEVLPTASPQASEMPTPRVSSPVSEQETSMVDSILGVDPDDEDQLPPRKISSSDALKAMSREPLDKGTAWTIVNNDINSTPDMASVSMQQAPQQPIAMRDPKPTVRESTTANSAATQSEEQLAYASDDDDSSDDGFLAMAKPKSFNNKKQIRSSTAGRNTRSTTATGDKADERREGPWRMRAADEGEHIPSEDLSIDEEEYDMFHFEAGGLSAPPRPKPRPPPLRTDNSPHDEDFDDNEPSAPVTQSIYATSPAVNISRPAPVASEQQPSTPTAAKFQPGSLGSYKGRSVVMPVVRDPEVHAQAEELGDFNTFVGGLDGRSGMDDGDLNSFRASVVPSGFSGTPRSMTERLMMEDVHKKRMANNKKS